MIYVDSNYWIYWLDSRLPEHKYVTSTMRSAIREGITISYVTLIEVAHYPRMLPREEFVRLTDTIQNLATLKILGLDDHIASLALKFVPDYAPQGLGSRDCVILATMKLSGLERIATHDRAFKTISDIEVVDSIPEA